MSIYSDSLHSRGDHPQAGARGTSLLEGASRNATDLIARFEDISRRFADRVAITAGSVQTTYADLNRDADRVATLLVAMRLAPEAIVAIYLERSVAMISALLGILKAGCAYLPLDPGYPLVRTRQVVLDAAPAVVITDQELAASLHQVPCRVLFHDTAASERHSDANFLPVAPRADSLAYLMYTSGSTGKPKGVLVTRQNVTRLFDRTEPWFHFDETDVWTMFHSFSFDFSVWEIWGPLLTGGRLVIVPFDVSRSPGDFYQLLSEQRVTVLNQTPSAFLLLSQAEESGNTLPLALRFVIFGGEALQYRALRSWFHRHGDTAPRLINMYGITETTVHVTYRPVTQADAEFEEESLIGVPIPDLQVYLLDAHGHPVADGEIGEMYIGGAGVARGYLNRPELNAQRFVADPFAPEGSRLYRSGDLARRRVDQELVYLGRSDDQVKINGFRIELGEIEAALSEFPGIRQAAVVRLLDESLAQRLAAYFVTTGNREVVIRDLRSRLAERLPSHMMPSFYTQLPAMPLTGNGKVDRAALPKPTTGSKVATLERSPLEGQIAAIWREVLQAEVVAFDENFFDIGGSSILLMAVRARVHALLGRQFPISSFFEFSTVRSFANYLLALTPGTVSPPPAAESPAMRSTQEQGQKQRDAFARMRSGKASIRRNGAR